METLVQERYHAFIPVLYGQRCRRIEFEVTASSVAEAIQKACERAVEEHHVLAPDVEPFHARKAWPSGRNQHWPITIGLEEIERAAGVNLDCSPATGYCIGYTERGRGKRYGDWEDEIATPFLISQGYKMEWCWCDGEADSGGPLFRQTTATKDGLWYRIQKSIKI
jgi:hypothetical protein